MNLLSKRTRYIAAVIALLVLMVSSVTGAAAAGIGLAADPSLVAYWDFNEGRGTTANDASGHGHTGTFMNQAQFSSSPLPPINFTNPFALSLVGTSHQYV